MTPMSRRLISEIPTLTPSGFESFTRCARLFLSTALLGIPESDPAPPNIDGLLVHDMLWRIHETGSCRDPEVVSNVLAAHGADTDLVRELVSRHAHRCPQGVEREAHEHSLARFHLMPRPMFMAVARIDAIWVHDGILDARDYKTGGRYYERVADVPAAKVQIYVLAAAAQRRGLRVRLRYEHLSPDVDDDPEPWEPGDDDLDEVVDDLRAVVARMHDETEWRGVAEPDVCGKCRYRSICRDTAAPGEPAWPVLALG